MRAFLPLAFASLAFAVPALADEITVFAASSLKGPLDTVAADWAAASGNSAVISYGGSSAIAKQIIEGAPAQVFISASKEWMDKLDEAKLTVDGARVDLMSNTLVLVGAPGAAAATVGPELDLVGLLGGGKLSMAMVDSVPAGQYGKAALESLGLWAKVEASVVQSENVRAALALVAAGEAPLGIVYGSDAKAEPGVAVVGEFPADSHPQIVYPAGLIAPETPVSRDFLTYLQSDAAKAVFTAQGFVALAP